MYHDRRRLGATRGSCSNGAVHRVLGACLVATLGCGDHGFIVVLDAGPADAAVDGFRARDGDVPLDAGRRDGGPSPSDGGPLADGFRVDAFQVDAFTPEICDNRTDDDGDAAIDCFDSDCGADAHCQPVDPEVCTNGVDDDDDGAIDCDDGDCAGETTCGTISESVLACLNDCVFLPENQVPACHLDCQTRLGVQGSRETDCTDGLDNDDDGQTDGDDFDC